MTVPVVSWSAVNWANATPVVPAAGQMRYVIPVPLLQNGGVAFDLNDVHARFTAEGRQVPAVGQYAMQQGVGAWFENPVDRSLQGVVGTGTGILVVNKVDAAAARLIHAALRSFGGPWAIQSADNVQRLVALIGEKAGKVDVYNSDYSWLRKNTPQPQMTEDDLTFAMYRFGFLPKTSEISLAAFVEGPVDFTGARGQNHHFAEGTVGVVLKNPAEIDVGGEKRPDIYGSQAEPFVSAYTLVGGRAITEANLRDLLKKLALTEEV